MAKVKKTKGAAHNTRKHKKTGGEAAWKRSPLVGVALTIIIIICLYSALFSGGGSGESLIPDNFPHTYLAVSDNGKYAALLIKRGKTDAKTPFTENDKEYWEAYVCRNEFCPGRSKAKSKKKDAEAKPYIFAGVRPKPPENANADNNGEGGQPSVDMYLYMQVQCPQCKSAYNKASSKNKLKYDLTAVERYMTDEAKQMLDKIREEYKKRAGNG